MAPKGTYQIKIAKSAGKSFAALPKDVQEKIGPRIADLANDPRPHDSKKLAGTDNVYRIRIGNYRVLYSIFDNPSVVGIVGVGDRKDVYRP